jgi:hypothetical protein
MPLPPNSKYPVVYTIKTNVNNDNLVQNYTWEIKTRSAIICNGMTILEKRNVIRSIIAHAKKFLGVDLKLQNVRDIKVNIEAQEQSL